MISRDTLGKRVEHWRRRVCPEWRVLLMDESHPDEATDERMQEACAYVESDLDIAVIRVYIKDSVLSLPADQRDRIIVHELLHPLLDRVLDHDHALHGFAPPPLVDQMIEQRRGDMEEFVNRMAHLISEDLDATTPYHTSAP